MTKPRPKLTRDALHASLAPPNNCRVKVFLDALDTESREVLEEALGYKNQDFNSQGLRTFLIDAGFDPAEIPGQSAIQDHRAGRRPCRCKG